MSNGIQKVDRKVDTVIMEIDSHVADMLLTVLNAVEDVLYTHPTYVSPLDTLADELTKHLRDPHPLYSAAPLGNNLVLFHDYGKATR